MGTVERYKNPSAHPTYSVFRHYRYAAIFCLRAEGKSYQEIAKWMCLSASHVRTLHKQALWEFYALVDTPVYKRPRVEPELSNHDMCMLYQLKDFLQEIADERRTNPG